jgi:hypothetical protein
MTTITRKTVALVTATALALAIPATGLANKGGQPHSTTACPTHTHSGKHMGSTHGKKKGAAKGKKCGTK